MFERLCRVVMRVLMPVLFAALSALFSVCSSVLHDVGLMSVRMGAAYVKRVLMSVLYRSVPMYGWIFLFLLKRCLILFIV